MTGHPTPHMTKAPTRSAKTHVGAQQKGHPSVIDPTRRAHRLIVAAGVALEEAIEADHAPAPTEFADQVVHAAHVLLDLRGKRDMDASWDVSVPKKFWDVDAPSLQAFVYGGDLPRGVSLVEEARAWADLLGTTVTISEAHTSGAANLGVIGTYDGVSVELSFYLPKSEVADARVEFEGSEVAA